MSTSIRRIIRFLFEKPFQEIKNHDRFSKANNFLQKWRGHHPNVDKEGMSVIYEEGSIPGTVCSMAFSPLK